MNSAVEKRAEARGAALAIIAKARRVDEIVAELGPLVGEIEKLERVIWRALAGAGAPPKGVVGQNDLANMAMEEVSSARQPAEFRRLHPLAEIAARAWACATKTEKEASA